MSDLFSIAGKTALITGGSRGIGLMIARAYVEHRAKVYISSRKAEVCDAAAAELSRTGECISLPADLSRSEEVTRIATLLKARERKLDILINNAGATWGASIDEFPEKGWDKVMDLNVKSVFFLTQQLLPLLDAAASAAAPARIINIGSIDGMSVTTFENFSYSASKAAVHRQQQGPHRKIEADLQRLRRAPGGCERLSRHLHQCEHRSLHRRRRTHE
jgi:NAD(P)-dependent dehydrogenase (short-subunit alcohol dehydrogenase family)